jgi:hypothetical protein
MLSKIADIILSIVGFAVFSLCVAVFILIINL